MYGAFLEVWFCISAMLLCKQQETVLTTTLGEQNEIAIIYINSFKNNVVYLWSMVYHPILEICKFDQGSTSICL